MAKTHARSRHCKPGGACSKSNKIVMTSLEIEDLYTLKRLVVRVK